MSKFPASKMMIHKWHDNIQLAINYDSWGQVVEAVEEYTRLARMMKSSVSGSSEVSFDENIMRTIGKIASCLEIRVKSLELMNSPPDIDLVEIKQLGEVLKNLEQNHTVSLPDKIEDQIENLRQSVENTRVTDVANSTIEDESVTKLSTSSFNSLLPRLPLESNSTLVTVKIEKIGLKNASSHIDPYLIVSCKEASGVDLCKSQKTPNATKRDDVFLYFDVDVEIQLPVERMARNSAIFFELKHYKPKRRMTSLKCFAFMEQDEMKPGPCVIELYQKPVDYKRKKLSLLTSKPLYLHLNLTLHSQ